MKFIKKFISGLVILGSLVNFCLFSTLDVNAVSSAVSSGIGLSAHCIKAYNENWQYSYGSATDGYVDCSGLIWSYNGVGGNRCDMLSASSEWGYVSNGIPRIHGLGLHQPGHVGVYIGSNQAIDARDYGIDCVLHNPYQMSWVEWFKIAGVSYPNTGWVFFNGQAFYYENGQYIVDTQREFDGVVYTFNSLGVSDILPLNNVYTETDYSNIRVTTESQVDYAAIAEEERIVAEKKAEEERLAAEKKAEEERLAVEEERLAAERRAEEERLAAEKKAEEERLAAEEERIAAEKKAEEERLAAERKAEEERLAVEEERLAAEKKVEEERLAAAIRFEEERLVAKERYAATIRFEEERLAAKEKLAAALRAEEERLVAEERLAAAIRAEEERLVAEERLVVVGERPVVEEERLVAVKKASDERKKELQLKIEREIEREIAERKEKVVKNKSFIKFKNMVKVLDSTDGLTISNEENFSLCNILIIKNSVLNKGINVNNVEENKMDEIIMIDLSNYSYFIVGSVDDKEKAKTEYMDIMYSDTFEFNNDVLAYSSKGGHL